MMTMRARTTVACTSTSSSDAARRAPDASACSAPGPASRKVSRWFWTRLKSLGLTSITPGVTGRKEQPGD
jgi:hypothetical protein